MELNVKYSKTQAGKIRADVTVTDSTPLPTCGIFESKFLAVHRPPFVKIDPTSFHQIAGIFDTPSQAVRAVNNLKDEIIADLDNWKKIWLPEGHAIFIPPLAPKEVTS